MTKQDIIEKYKLTDLETIELEDRIGMRYKASGRFYAVFDQTATSDELNPVFPDWDWLDRHLAESLRDYQKMLARKHLKLKK